MVVVRIIAVRPQSTLLIVIWMPGDSLVGVYSLDLCADGLL